MKSLIVPVVAVLVLTVACASIMGRWSESKLDSMSEKCLTENEGLKPSEKGLSNLSSQARTRKKREIEDYKKKRIDLYQSLHTFKVVYTAHIGGDGKCHARECALLEKTRQEIIKGCPGVGESFPHAAAE
jgi:hypothetical protein